MARSDDTNLVARGGLAGLRRVQGWAQGVMDASPTPEELRHALSEADGWFTEAWLSPGGSADLLAVTWWLAQVRE
jgi:triphosphoribosyl-dephospho-CoA synthetase